MPKTATSRYDVAEHLLRAITLFDGLRVTITDGTDRIESDQA